MEKKKRLIICLLVELLGVVSDITAIVLISLGARGLHLLCMGY